MEFYIIWQKNYTEFASAIWVDETKDEIWECPCCGAIYSKRLPNAKLYLKGKKAADYYYATNCNIISGKMQKLLLEAEITGFTLRDLDIQEWYDKKGKKLDLPYDDLKEIVITGRCGYLRHKDGRIVDKCNLCGGKNYKKQGEVNGLSVNLKEWDKSDMFYFKNWEGPIIVTEKVKEIVEKNKLKNIRFENIKDFKFL